MDMPPRSIKLSLRDIINIQKGGTFFAMLYLMYHFKNFSTGPFMYLALHGMYGIIWIMKDYTFGDPSFQVKTSLGTALSTVLILLAYWYNGYALMSGVGIQSPTPERMCTALLCFIIGAIFMMGSDLQKNITLKYKKGLIDDGFFKYTRNPNYFGEILIYGSFSILTGNPISWVIHIFVWATLFSLRMLIKENSFAEKIGGKE